jgi:quinol monooxygenase YgiN
VARLALVGTIEIAPGRKDQLLSALMAHKARCLKDEPGTLQMEVLSPREDDAELLVYEVYRDDAAFDVHRNGRTGAAARIQPLRYRRKREAAPDSGQVSTPKLTPFN